MATMPVMAMSSASVGEPERARTKSAGVTNPLTWLTDHSRARTMNTIG